MDLDASFERAFGINHNPMYLYSGASQSKVVRNPIFWAQSNPISTRAQQFTWHYRYASGWGRRKAGLVLSRSDQCEIAFKTWVNPSTWLYLVTAARTSFPTTLLIISRSGCRTIYVCKEADGEWDWWPCRYRTRQVKCLTWWRIKMSPCSVLLGWQRTRSLYRGTSSLAPDLITFGNIRRERFHEYHEGVFWQEESGEGPQCRVEDSRCQWGKPYHSTFRVGRMWLGSSQSRRDIAKNQ